MAVDEWGIDIVEEVEFEKVAKKKKKSVWDTMASAVDRTKPYAKPEEIDAISPFMFSRLLSNNIMSVFWAEELNTHINIPKDRQYQFVRLSFPKNKVKYIRYPKSKEDYDKDVIKNACYEFKCGQEQAIRYLNMLPESEFDKFVDKYETNKKFEKEKLKK
jgi:hypothetical protein